jgi:hypothetical protein
VCEIEFDLLPRTLDEKRRVGVDDRPESLFGHPGGKSNKELFPDAHVDDTPGVTVNYPGLSELGDADVGQDQGDVGVAVQQLRCDGNKTLSHC